MDAAIQAANDRMVYVTGDKEEIWAYERYLMALSDRTSEMNYARDEGRAEGIQKGREEIIRNALAKGLPIETVQEITGIDIKFIQNIQAERI